MSQRNTQPVAATAAVAGGVLANNAKVRVDLPRPTADQQQFLEDIQARVKDYDPNTLICGHKVD
ncbi:hypothetical protein [Methylorubrum extorquens]|uniref:Uncharacterized protein n=1 Tax=Methylorubrum extorquens DSM 13060 TaxID=882800 RepID=H1KHR2_METEX|nr:hypothetical protein [Methylorubrum extorquens]EHP92940.1 hypothetical protein MetexDRAFT_2174 [Methylorubrum extorquens DSM 13060]